MTRPGCFRFDSATLIQHFWLRRYGFRRPCWLAWFLFGRR